MATGNDVGERDVVLEMDEPHGDMQRKMSSRKLSARPETSLKKSSSSSSHSSKSSDSSSSSKISDDGLTPEERKRKEAEKRKEKAGNFIPVKYHKLVKHFAEERLPSHNKSHDWISAWAQTFRLLPLETLIRNHERFKHLSREYSDLDPDEASAHDVDVDKQKKECAEQDSMPEGWDKHFRKKISWLLAASGYQPVTDEMLEVADQKQGKYGLDVSIPTQDEVRCQVYYRGQYNKTEHSRTWKNCFTEKVEKTEPCFKEVVFVYHYNILKDEQPDSLLDKLKWRWLNIQKRRPVGPEGCEGKIFLRCYKDIPEYDMDLLWPGATPNPKILDTLLVVIPFFVGIGMTIWKLYKLGNGTSELSNEENILVVMLAIVTPLGISLKSLIRAKNKYTKYKMHQADMLAQHTLSTNRGTMAQLTQEAAEQDNKELCTAYTTLALNAPKRLTVDDLRNQCADYVHGMADKNEVNFDVEGAVEQLREREMLVEDNDGTLSCVEPTRAQHMVSLSQYEDRKLRPVSVKEALRSLN